MLRPLFDPTNQFNNKNGSILVGGKLYVYYINRTALADSWKDENKISLNTNPIILDNNGRAQVFVDSIYSYTLVVCDRNGKELFSQDISVYEGGSGVSGLADITSDGTIHVTTAISETGTIFNLGVNQDAVAMKSDISSFYNVDVKGGANISVSTAIDGLDKTFTISGSEGKIYDGISPIVVDNENNLISLDSDYISDVSGAIDFVSGSLTSKQDKLTEEQLSAISSISSLDTKFYPLNENPSGYLTTAETTDLMSASLLEISDNKITAYNGTAFAGQDDGPNADLSGVNIDISLDPTSSYIVLSAKDYTDDITAIGNDLSYVSGKVDSVSSELSGAVDYVSANIGDAFTGVNVNIPLTGDGKTSALGLMSYISWGGNGTTSTFSRSGVRVLDENGNSAYYLASGLNLNNESITDSSISAWNDTRTTVESNSANWGGITSVDTNHGISGNGTTSTPIGIASSFQLENPSVYTTATYKGDSIGIVGIMPRIQLKTDNSSYNTLGEGGMTITHSASGVGGGYTTSHYGSTMRLSYNDGDYYLHTMDTTKSGLGVTYKGNSNVKAYYNYSGVALTNDNGATNEYVNVASIRNWNDVYDTVSSNSASWTGGGGSVDTIPFVVQSPLTTGFTGDSAYIGIDSTAINLSSYVPYSALTTSYASTMITNINGSSLYVNSARNAYNAQTAQRSYGDRNGNEITSYYQPKLTIGGENNTITSINSSAIGSTNTATWELVEGTNISIVDDVATSSTTISVSGISATEWNETYNAVNTNSGTWGGSALNISASSGVKAELVDNTLVFSNDETLLWSGTRAFTESGGWLLSEPITNFEYALVCMHGYNNTQYGSSLINIDTSAVTTNLLVLNWAGGNDSVRYNMCSFTLDDSSARIGVNRQVTLGFNGTISTANASFANVFKIVGINRKQV